MPRACADQVQIAINSNTGTETLFIYPVGVLPVKPEPAWLGAAYSHWLASDGATGTKPSEPELVTAVALLRDGGSKPEAERTKMAQEIWRLAVERQWVIGLVGQSPAYMGIRLANKGLENVPARTCISQQCRTPRAAVFQVAAGARTGISGGRRPRAMAAADPTGSS